MDYLRERNVRFDLSRPICCRLKYLCKNADVSAGSENRVVMGCGKIHKPKSAQKLPLDFFLFLSSEGV